MFISTGTPLLWAEPMRRTDFTASLKPYFKTTNVLVKMKVIFTRDNFSCNLQRNDDENKSLQVAKRMSNTRNFLKIC